MIILHNKILWILRNAPWDTPVVELYAKFNTLPTPGLHKCQILKLVHKFIPIIKINVHLYFQITLPKHIFHTYNTRTKDYFHVVLLVSCLGQRSIKYTGNILWNGLPAEIKSIR